MSKLHTQFLGLIAGMAIVAGTASMADATPTFTICPNAITGISGYSCSTQSDFNGTSDALIQQTGTTTQTETGWVQGGTFTDNGTTNNVTVTGMMSEPGLPDTYNIYITFTATVTGISGFSPGQIGTVSQFNFTVYADVGNNDIFTAGTTSGTAPSVTDTGGNDLVLAEGSLISGTAGFQPTTGAPTFNAISDFILCDGTANQGMLGGTVITGGAATGCGTFDAALYFTAPNPFYSINFDSTTSGSVQDLTVAAPYATLNGIVVDINFLKVPEPSSLLLLGTGILGLGLLARRRRKA